MTYNKKKRRAPSHANCVSLITEERAREIVDKRDREANALFNVINKGQLFDLFFDKEAKTVRYSYDSLNNM